MKIELKKNWQKGFGWSIVGWSLLIYIVVGAIETFDKFFKLIDYATAISEHVQPSVLLQFTARDSFLSGNVIFVSLLVGVIITYLCRMNCEIRNYCALCGKLVYRSEAKFLSGKKWLGKPIKEECAGPSDFICKEHKVKL